MSETTSPETQEEWIVVFQSDLFTCRERLAVLLEEEINAQIIAAEDVRHDGMPTYMQVIVLQEDIEEVVEIFAEIWKETLSTEGLDESEIQQVAEDVVDLSQDTVICPGCQKEISEITEDGECIECGLFLGFPDEEDEEE